MNNDQDQRKFLRFDTDIKVSFKIPYQFRTEINFKVEPERKKDDHTYIGFSRNISVSGLCFESPKELACGDLLWIELHLPKHSKEIYMEGEVRWSQVGAVTANAPRQYITGVSIRKVDGVNVNESIFLDKDYNVLWSELLEKVLGSFARICRENKNKPGESAGR